MSRTSSPAAKPLRTGESGEKIDAKLVREIATLLSESDLTEIEVEKGDLRIRVARQVVAAPVYAQAPVWPPRPLRSPPPRPRKHPRRSPITPTP